jgi:hypothetical protein
MERELSSSGQSSPTCHQSQLKKADAAETWHIYPSPETGID